MIIVIIIIIIIHCYREEDNEDIPNVCIIVVAMVHLLLIFAFFNADAVFQLLGVVRPRLSRRLDLVTT